MFPAWNESPTEWTNSKSGRVVEGLEERERTETEKIGELRKTDGRGEGGTEGETDKDRNKHTSRQTASQTEEHEEDEGGGEERETEVGAGRRGEGGGGGHETQEVHHAPEIKHLTVTRSL